MSSKVLHISRIIRWEFMKLKNNIFIMEKNYERIKDYLKYSINGWTLIFVEPVTISKTSCHGLHN